MIFLISSVTSHFILCLLCNLMLEITLVNEANIFLHIVELSVFQHNWPFSLKLHEITNLWFVKLFINDSFLNFGSCLHLCLHDFCPDPLFPWFIFLMLCRWFHMAKAFRLYDYSHVTYTYIYTQINFIYNELHI